LPIADCRLPIGNRVAQARAEAGKFFVHAVLFVGWFSATAERQDSAQWLYRKTFTLLKV
jgi:hypothetical protein